MLTPMIILSLLVLPWLLPAILRRDAESRRFGGVLGVCLVFLFTGVGHFIKTEPMAQMLPGFVPLRTPLVIATGVLELILAVMILIPAARRSVGVCLMAMLVVFLPVNVYAAMERVPMGGHAWGPSYLAIRLPLQALLIVWVYAFAVRSHRLLRSADDQGDA